ncbi:MAG: CheR family methyltransferase [Armatimonadota bacterium]
MTTSSNDTAAVSSVSAAPARLPRQPTPDPELEWLIERISSGYGFDVRAYKRSTLYRRIRKRMHDARCGSPREYLLRLEGDPEELQQLLSTLLINITEFFRDPEAWEALRRLALEPLLQDRAPDQPVRAWSVGCATGEEAYSLAMLLSGWTDAGGTLKLFATDVSQPALAAARTGTYPHSSLRNVSPDRLERFFEPRTFGYAVRRELRAAVTFGAHDILRDPPISRLDLLVCRNVLIYLGREAQHQVLRRFHYALREGGCLFLGKAETLMTRSHLFEPLDSRYRIFRRLP